MLWGLFWVVLALGVSRLTAFAGWLTLLLSITTCSIPGFLLLLGDWDKVPTWAVLASIGVVAVLAVVLAPVALRPAPGDEAPAEVTVAVAG